MTNPVSKAALETAQKYSNNVFMRDLAETALYWQELAEVLQNALDYEHGLVPRPFPPGVTVTSKPLVEKSPPLPRIMDCGHDRATNEGNLGHCWSCIHGIKGR